MNKVSWVVPSLGSATQGQSSALCHGGTWDQQLIRSGCLSLGFWSPWFEPVWLAEVRLCCTLALHKVLLILPPFLGRSLFPVSAGDSVFGDMVRGHETGSAGFILEVLPLAFPCLFTPVLVLALAIALRYGD